MSRTSFAVRGIATMGLALALAACGQTTSERTTGGAAAGAAAGAGVGALAGPPGALVGAAIGAGAGAVTGATTTPQDVNLGRPPWTNPEARVPGVSEGGPRAGRRAMRSTDGARQAQQALAQAGYNPGPADGVWGAQSTRALRDYQRANNLAVTGRLDDRTMSALRTGGSPGAARAGSPPSPAAGPAPAAPAVPATPGTTVQPGTPSR